MPACVSLLGGSKGPWEAPVEVFAWGDALEKLWHSLLDGVDGFLRKTRIAENPQQEPI